MAIHHRTDIDAIEANNLMIKSLDELRAKFQSTVSNATAIAILQQNPCLLRCLADIQNIRYGGDIDPLFIARHDYAKIRLVDRIAQQYCGRFEVGSEHMTRIGKLDVAIINQKIILTNGNKVIGIEVKSGKSIDIFQLERYLLECDKLVIVRVPTVDVVSLDRSDLSGDLENTSVCIHEKAEQILKGENYKVQGPWCYECEAVCEYRKERRRSSPSAKLEGTAEFIRNVNVVVEKTMELLRKELDGKI